MKKFICLSLVALLAVASMASATGFIRRAVIVNTVIATPVAVQAVVPVANVVVPSVVNVQAVTPVCSAQVVQNTVVQSAVAVPTVSTFAVNAVPFQTASFFNVATPFVQVNRFGAFVNVNRFVGVNRVVAVNRVVRPVFVNRFAVVRARNVVAVRGFRFNAFVGGNRVIVRNGFGGRAVIRVR